MSQITLKKSEVKKQNGVVILPLKEYEKLLRRAVPTYYLTGKAAIRLDKLVEEGIKEYRAGKTIRATSLTDALKVYERKH